jgi:hypothetical protein
MCGSREWYGEFSFGGGVPLPAGAVVGAGVIVAEFPCGHFRRKPPHSNLILRCSQFVMTSMLIEPYFNKRRSFILNFGIHQIEHYLQTI